MNNKAIVEIKNVSFSYGCHNVLDNVNLCIKQGDVVAVTGPNGAGKSTLLKLIMGALKPVQGEITIFGQQAGNAQVKKRIGYVPQRATAFNQGFPTTVLEAVVAGCIANKGLFKPLNAKDYAQAEKSLHMVGIYPLRHKLLSSLSGGQQQRVFIARAIVSQPDLIILDEPTVGIDAQAQYVIIQLLKDLNLQGLTIIIVSHELEVIAPIINRQVCLDKKACHCSCHDSEQKAIRELNCRKSIWAYQ